MEGNKLNSKKPNSAPNPKHFPREQQVAKRYYTSHILLLLLSFKAGDYCAELMVSDRFGVTCTSIQSVEGGNETLEFINRNAFGDLL